MKYFLVVLLGVLPFFSPAQVTIPDDVARFFLEQHDRAVILTKKDSLNKIEIKGLNLIVIVKDSLINSYKRDSILYKRIGETKEEMIKSLQIDNKNLTKEANLQHIKVSVLTGTTAGALIGTAIPAVGTLAGTLVGGAIGFVVYGVKSITRSHR